MNRLMSWPAGLAALWFLGVAPAHDQGSWTGTLGDEPRRTANCAKDRDLHHPSSDKNQGHDPVQTPGFLGGQSDSTAVLEGI